MLPNSKTYYKYISLPSCEIVKHTTSTFTTFQLVNNTSASIATLLNRKTNYNYNCHVAKQ